MSWSSNVSSLPNFELGWMAVTKPFLSTLHLRSAKGADVRKQ